MRDRDQPSSLDDPTLEAGFPIRHVALFCDRGCDTETEADIRADSAEQAYEGLRRVAVTERGWQVTKTEDICPRLREPLRGKLVRDRIPEIIRQAGSIPIIETASPQDYSSYVRAKLTEELEEYLSSGDVAELADLIEVIFAAAALHGVGQTELLAIARDKRQACGAFAKRLVWLGNEPVLTRSAG